MSQEGSFNVGTSTLLQSPYHCDIRHQFTGTEAESHDADVLPARRDEFTTLKIKAFASKLLSMHW